MAPHIQKMKENISRILKCDIADVKETFDAGYDVINTVGGHLYIVPGEDLSLIHI